MIYNGSVSCRTRKGGMDGKQDKAAKPGRGLSMWGTYSGAKYKGCQKTQ